MIHRANQFGSLLHVRSTVAFTGAVGLGAIGTVTVFTVTGRVLVPYLTAFCTATLVGATAIIQLGSVNGANFFIGATTATDLATNEWWNSASPPPGLRQDIIDQSANAERAATVQENILIDVSVANVTGGTIVFDAWYLPITDNGALA